MKHLLITHSPGTYLCALAVITELELDPRDCVVLGNGRPYEKPVETINLLGRIGKKDKIVHFFNYPGLLRKELRKVTGGEEFTCYTPMMYDLSRILVSDPQCRKIAFLEEGTNSYIEKKSVYFCTQDHRYDPWDDRLFSKSRLRALYSVIRGFNPKLKSMPLYYEAYTNCRDVDFYGFSEDSFPDARRKTIVSVKKALERFGITPACRFRPDDLIFISDDAVETYRYPLDRFLGLVRQYLLPMLGQRTRLYYKSHPKERPDKIAAVKKIFTDRGIEVEYVNKEVILENELYLSEPVTLVGFDSTLLMYGAFAGSRAYSIPRDLARGGEGDLPAFDKNVKTIVESYAELR